MGDLPATWFSALWTIFSLSFLTALTGAMSPGPLLTYTIMRTVQTRRRGYLVGAWVIAGHAMLEAGIILLLMLGFSFVLKHPMVVRAIGVIGGLILVGFGLQILRDVVKGRVSTSFLNTEQGEKDAPSATSRLSNPILGGILVSMANPYWWVWWATIGFAFMLQFNITFQSWPKMVSFFLGHEAGDLLWYLVISFAAFFGLRHLNRKLYYGILSLCGLFMIAFGLWLGVTPFFSTGT